MMRRSNEVIVSFIFSRVNLPLFKSLFTDLKKKLKSFFVGGLSFLKKIGKASNDFFRKGLKDLLGLGTTKGTPKGVAGAAAAGAEEISITGILGTLFAPAVLVP